MFKKLKADRIKRKALKQKEEVQKIYTFSHMLLVLFNNLKLMKSIGAQEKGRLFNLYTQTLYNSMKDKEKIYFSKALLEVNDAVDKISHAFPSSAAQIKNQLQEIFKSSN